MKSVLIMVVGILCLVSLTSVEAMPGAIQKIKDVGKHANKNYCEELTVEAHCGNKLFYWCDVGKTGGALTKADNTCRYTAAFYVFVLGIPALVIIILVIVGVVMFRKSKYYYVWKAKQATGL